MRRALIFVAAAGLLAASPPSKPSPEAVRTGLQNFVRAYADAANKADVTAVMEMYSRRSEVTSIGDGEITRGWEAIRSETGAMVGKEGSYKISIGTIDALPLGASHALAFAPYTVTIQTEQGPAQISAAMTLVLEKSGPRWKILHEHMSLKAANEGD